MGQLEERLAQVQASIAAACAACGRAPSEVSLIAATKTQSHQTIRQAIAAGVTLCGENRVQELNAHLEADAYQGAGVHFIGQLQTNKVRFVVGRVALIHSVSSEKLLLAIQRQAEKLGVIQPILLEVNLAGEVRKAGFSPQQVHAAARLARTLPNLSLGGLMCIPPAASRQGENRPYFEKLAQLAVDIRGEIGDNGVDSFHLSMGMSGDYQDAISAGATLIRLGTALFGPRPAPNTFEGSPIHEPV